MKTTSKTSMFTCVLITLLAAASFTSCQKEANSLKSSNAKATVNSDEANTDPANDPNAKHTVLEFPGSFTTHLDCIGEDVFVTGNVRLTFITVVNDNHYNMKIIFHSLNDDKAVGLTSGNEFFVRGENVTTMQGSFQNGQARNSYINTFSYIGKGQLPNIYFHQTTNFVVNADGAVTASVDEATIDCVQ